MSLAAAPDLGWRGFVAGRRAFYDAGDVSVAQLEPVGSAHRAGLVGKAGLMERPIQPVTRPVAREDPSRPIGAMRGRREPDEHQAGRRVAEACDRLPPVFLIRV